MKYFTSKKVMHSLVLIVLAAVASFASVSHAADSAAVANKGAYDVVQSTMNELLVSIEANRPLYQQDSARFFADVEKIVGPSVDFKRISRRVMARYYRKTTNDQRERFVQAFKESMMKLYAKGLLQYNNQEIDVLPAPKNARTKPNRQKVDIAIHGKNGSKFPISYSMFRNKSGEWMMENVVVNGVNIGLTYRNQFARLVKVNKRNIDKVIDGWSSKVNGSAE